MANEQKPMTTPYGQGPENLPNPVPTENITTQPIEPLRAPAQSVPVSGIKEFPVEAAPGAIEEFPIEEFPIEQAQPEMQGPPEPVDTALSTAPMVGMKIIRLSDQKRTYGTLDEKGEPRKFTDNEKKAFSYVAKAARIGGPVVGGILGDIGGFVAGGLLGPVGAVAGAVAGGSAGSVAGGEAAHPVAAFYEELAGETPKERTTGERIGEAVGGGIGSGIGQGISALARRGASQLPVMLNVASGETGQVLAETGGKALAQIEAQRLAAAQTVKEPIFSYQVSEHPAEFARAQEVASGGFGKTSAEALQAGVAAQGEATINRIEAIGKKIGDPITAEVKSTTRMKNIFDEMADRHTENISGLADEARALSHGKRQPADKLIVGFDKILQNENVISRTGKLNERIDPSFSWLANERQRLKTELGPIGEKGMSFEQADLYRIKVKEKANFDSPNPTQAELAARKLYNEVVEFRDDITADIFTRAGKPEKATELRKFRDEYHENIEVIRDNQRLFANDPDVTVAIPKLLRSNSGEDFAKLQKLIKYAGPENAEVIGRATFDHIFKSGAAENTKFATAVQAQKTLNNLPVNNVIEIFGGGKVGEKNLTAVNEILNYMRATEGKKLNFSTPAGEKAGVKLLTTLGKLDAVVKPLIVFVNKKLRKNPTAEILAGKIMKKFPEQFGGPTPVRDALSRPTSPIATGIDAGAVPTLDALVNPPQ